jgi:hypothetical protein
MNGPTLFRLIRFLGGSYEHVAALLDEQDTEAAPDDARALATSWALRPAEMGDRRLTPEEEVAELWNIALGRAGGDVDEARRLLLRALDKSMPKRGK